MLPALLQLRVAVDQRQLGGRLPTTGRFSIASWQAMLCPARFLLGSALPGFVWQRQLQVADVVRTWFCLFGLCVISFQGMNMNMNSLGSSADTCRCVLVYTLVYIIVYTTVYTIGHTMSGYTQYGGKWWARKACSHPASDMAWGGG